MNKRELFSEMLVHAKEQNFGYIGIGNPDAHILIIENEISTAQNETKTMQEFNDNLELWERDKNKKLNEIPSRNRDAYSPLCPYKGQLLKLDNGERRGMSKAWKNYQKLNNHIFFERLIDVVNFHKNFFITNLKNNANSVSISKRKDFIKNSAYFQSFQIVILAGVKYYEIAESKNEIEEMFKVQFVEKKLVGKKQAYWIYCNNDKSKLVISTAYQFNQNTADGVLKKIAGYIIPMYNKFASPSIEESIKQSQERWKNGGKEIHDKYMDNPEEFSKTDDFRDYMAWLIYPTQSTKLQWENFLGIKIKDDVPFDTQLRSLINRVY